MGTHSEGVTVLHKNTVCDTCQHLSAMNVLKSDSCDNVEPQESETVRLMV